MLGMGGWGDLDMFIVGLYGKKVYLRVTWVESDTSVQSIIVNESLVADGFPVDDFVRCTQGERCQAENIGKY